MEPTEVRVEAPLTGYMFHKASKAKIPISGTFELSPVCNFQCRMCYIRKTAGEVRNSGRPIMTKKEWLNIAEQARDAGMLYLLLTGGEPLLWPDFWSLYEELIRMGFLISINTNGSLIDGEAIERFRKMPPTRINITLYGAGDVAYERLCQVKGVFTKVEQAINDLQRAGIMVKLNGTLTPDNAGDMEACYEYAREHDLIYETNTYMFPPLRRDASMIGQNERFTPAEAAKYRARSYKLSYGEDLYRKYLEGIEKGYVPPPGLDESCIDPQDGKIKCRAGKAAFWVTWDGWMTPCGMMPEPKVEIRERSFLDVWKELTEIGENLNISSVCTQCPNRKICHSCAAMAMAETGETSGIPKYLCQMVEELKRFASSELAEKRTTNANSCRCGFDI